jgi:hypothetical protein
MKPEQYDALIAKLDEIIALLKEDKDTSFDIQPITMAEYEKWKADGALVVIEEISKQVKRRGGI